MHPTWVFAADFSPDGKNLVTACFDRVARIWDLERGRLIPPGLKHGGGVHACKFSPDGAWIVTASYDSTVRLWNVATQEPVRPVAILPGSAQAFDVAIAPDGRHVAMGCDDGSVRVWDLAATGAFPQRTFDTYTLRGDRYFNAPDDKTLRLVDRIGARLAELHFDEPVRKLSVSNDGAFVATVSGPTNSSAVSVWNVSRPQKPIFAVTGAVDQVFLSGDGALLATWSGTQIVAHAVARGVQLFKTSSKYNKDIQVVFDARSATVAVIKNKIVEVRSTTTGELHFPEYKFPGTVQQLVFSQDGHRFVVGCNDGAFSRHPAQVFDSATGAPLSPAVYPSRRDFGGALQSR
jgi:WD40 repeat protein